MGKIQELISKNLIELAFDEMLKSGNSNVTLLKSRYNSLKYENMMGIISHGNYNIEMNRIIHAMLIIAGEIEIINNRGYSSTGIAIYVTKKSELFEIIKKFKRRSPMIAEKANDIVLLINAYEKENSLTPGFDISGKLNNEIILKYNDLITEVSYMEVKAREKAIESIKKCISESIPSFANLQLAYEIASGYGLKSEYIERQLIHKIPDNEINIKIAEILEEFIRRL